MIAVTDIGWKAHAALERAGGLARALAPLSESIYLRAADEIVWLGGPGSPLHPRAILTGGPLGLRADVVWIDATSTRPWRAKPFRFTPGSAAAIVDGCRRLGAALQTVGVPRGLGTLLVDAGSFNRGAGDDEFLDRAAPWARALARACATEEHAGAVEAASTLLGLGPGLTPAGDDYVGGAFFARVLLARAGAADREAWATAASTVLGRAADLTHPVSAALLADLLEGDGHAPLHDLARALAEAGPLEAIVDAARRLVALGHSSGWDILAGFIGGATGA